MPAPAAAANDDDDFDLFADEVEEESEEKEKIKAARVEAYNAKKSKKEAIIAKSTIIMDVKPWDDETDMKALEASVRAIEMDGLLWGTGKLVPVAYGVKKLQITCVIEDDKVNLSLSIYSFLISLSLSLFRLVPNY
jgi:translation elongation factor EF-1beta